MALLRTKGVGKSYGGFVALSPTSLALPSKGIYAVKGKSGSGKSTLLNLLSGIERPSAGHVLFAKEDIIKRGRPLLGHEGAMVFQHYNLIENETALYNVALPSLIRGEGKRKAKELLRKFGLWPFARKNVSTLSGGQRQRVAVCRALVNDPEVLFADEPTGALDENSSKEVMEALRRIGEDRLVLFVSHNAELIDEYAQGVIEVRDGRVVANSVPLEKTTARRKRRYGHSVLWIGRFIFRNVRKNAFKDVVCLLAGAVGFCSLLLSVGFFLGNGPAFEAEQSHTLFYPCASVSKREEIEVPGSKLVLIKKTRPSAETVHESLGEGIGAHVEEDYSYFFPNVMTFSLDGQSQEPIQFQPLWDYGLTGHGGDMLVQGHPPKEDDFSSCLVNEEFLAKYGSDALGRVVAVACRSTVHYLDKQVEVYVEARFTVMGVVKEFAFLNSPRVYYSYHGLKERLLSLRVENGLGDAISVADMVSSAAEDSPYGGYGRLLFMEEASAVPALFALMEKGNVGDLEFVSQAYALRESFRGLSDAFVSSLGLFVGIALSGLALILAMACLSSFVTGRKETAVLMVLGAKRKEIFLIYMVESALLCLFSSALSLAISPLLQNALNLLLRQKFDVSGLIEVPMRRFMDVPFLLPILLLIGSMAFGLIAAMAPMLLNKGSPISEELRDE